LQEPTSFSILAEYAVFGLKPEQATLGLSWQDALACFDLQAYGDQRMARLRPAPARVASSADGQVWRLFDVEAEPFFQAFRVSARGKLSLDQMSGFLILIVLRGSGQLHSRAPASELGAGQTWVVPYAAGPLQLQGDIDVVLCMPPTLRSGT
jgi:mannose-6-phosphate isomerase